MVGSLLAWSKISFPCTTPYLSFLLRMLTLTVAGYIVANIKPLKLTSLLSLTLGHPFYASYLNKFVFSVQVALCSIF